MPFDQIQVEMLSGQVDDQAKKPNDWISQTMLRLIGVQDVDRTDDKTGFNKGRQGKRKALSAATQPSRHF